MPKKTLLLLISLFILSETYVTYGQEHKTINDLSLLSFDELLDVKVISASKSLTSISEAPSVISVKTAKDISEQGLKLNFNIGRVKES